MTKRIVTLLLAVVFVLSCSMLASCSNGKTTDNKKPTSSPTSESSKPENSSKPVSPSTPVDPSTPVEPSSPVSAEEPDKEADPQAWVKWLVGDDTDQDDYPMFYEAAFYDNCDYDGADGDKKKSPWECWPGGPGAYTDKSTFHMCLKFSRDEMDFTPNIGTPDYEFNFEFFYKPSDSEDYQRAIVPVRGDYGSFGPTNPVIIYRFLTYAGGMNLVLPEGETEVEYEFVVVVHKGDISGTDSIVGYAQVWGNWTDGSAAYLDDAIKGGFAEKKG